MAKKAVGSTNKTAIIKEILASGVKSPKEVVAIAKEKHGLDIKPGYVSIVKSTSKKKPGRKITMKRTSDKDGHGSSSGRAKPTGGRGSTNGLNEENAALRFALAAGGVEKAIKMLEGLR